MFQNAIFVQRPVSSEQALTVVPVYSRRRRRTDSAVIIASIGTSVLIDHQLERVPCSVRLEQAPKRFYQRWRRSPLESTMIEEQAFYCSGQEKLHLLAVHLRG